MKPSTESKGQRQSREMCKLHAARRLVRHKYPSAFGWREFTVSDYAVKKSPGGETIATGASAREAWENAARRINVGL